MIRPPVEHTEEGTAAKRLRRAVAVAVALTVILGLIGAVLLLFVGPATFMSVPTTRDARLVGIWGGTRGPGIPYRIQFNSDGTGDRYIRSTRLRGFEWGTSGGKVMIKQMNVDYMGWYEGAYSFGPGGELNVDGDRLSTPSTMTRAVGP